MDDSNTLVVVSTRLPADLHSRFGAICDSEHRSMSAQMLRLIEQFVDETEKNLTQGG